MLAGLREALDEALAGRGRLVLVAGEAGVGKSAVVRGFCEQARGPAQVFWGGCDALFTHRPLVSEARKGDTVWEASVRGPCAGIGRSCWAFLES